jgi:putative N6-adenine-specific DNA methylase
MKIIAKTLFGFEDILINELENLGIQNINKLNRAVEFEGDLSLLYKVNYNSRLAIKFLVELFNFDARNEDDLYHNVYNFDWENQFSVDQTFAIFSTVNSRNFKHSKYASLKMKDAIVDRFRDKFGKRPSVSVDNPDIIFNLHISDFEVNIMLDSSGESLHKRGYRSKILEANLSEVLAAGMLTFAGYNGEEDFYDLMCGSGTILTEAALISQNIPSGYFRNSYQFMKWSNFDKSSFKKMKQKSDSNIRSCKNYLYGSDLSKKAIDVLREVIASNEYFSKIKVKVADISQVNPYSDSGLIILNPPYDDRIRLENINELYRKIGKTLKFEFENHNAWIISSNFEALKFVGLKPAKKIKLFNGNLECRYNHYELFKGKRKDREG